MGKSTISMVIFNSYVSHYQRVDPFTWNLNHQKASAEIVSLEPSLKWSPAMRSFISSISPAMHWFCWENLHWVYHVWLVMLLVRFNHLEKIYEFVNGKDDIPYMKWKINTVWNHQPDFFFPWHMGVFRIQHDFQPIDWSKLINAENRRPYRCLNFDSHSNPSTIKPSFTQRWPILQGNWLVQQITYGKTMTFWSTERRPQYI